MIITKEFIEAEMAGLAQEQQKAQAFIVQAQGALDAYKLMLVKLNEPEKPNDPE